MRPNILVFFTDQQRWDTCGCYGANPMNLTPALDAMARRGTMVRHSFTVQPVCGPARSCFQTGKYATQTGVFRNQIGLPTTERTIAHHLGGAGYFTGYIGKWHLARRGKQWVPPELRGGYNDFWLAADGLEHLSHPYDLRLWTDDGRLVHRPGYRVDAQTDCAIEFLEERARNRPFLLFNSYLEPHHQNDMNRYVAPDGYAERYRSGYVPPDLQQQEGDWPEQLADYYGCCASLDENLGRILAALQRTGLEEDTMVLFCSDHGSHFRTRNSEYKRSCHESSIRVPTVFQGPGFDRGTVVDEMVSLLDWPATLLDAAGIPVPPDMQGRSLLPLLDGSAPDWPDSVLIQISESEVGRALRTRQWKFGAVAPDADGWNDSASGVYVEQSLYNLASDPWELRNLAGSPETRGVATELAAALRQRIIEAGESPPEVRTL